MKSLLGLFAVVLLTFSSVSLSACSTPNNHHTHKHHEHSKIHHEHGDK